MSSSLILITWNKKRDNISILGGGEGGGGGGGGIFTHAKRKDSWFTYTKTFCPKLASSKK